MSSEILQLVQLILIGPIFALLIWIDRYIFSYYRNPLVPFPRTPKELIDHPKDFFDWLAAHCIDETALPRGAKFVRIEDRGGASSEPDKAVVKARLYFTDAKLSEPRHLDIFCKMPTARPYSVLFKTLISTFSTCTKEVQWCNVVEPKLRQIALARGKKLDLPVPQNICAAWSRPFERSVAVSRELDASKWHSRPDWKNSDEKIERLMLTTIAKLHALTFDCSTPGSKHQPDGAVHEMCKTYFPGEVGKPVVWLESVLKLFISKQPSSVQDMWAAIRSRLANEPTVISHADYRQGNMLFNSDYTEIVVTDLEAVSVTYAFQDVAYSMFTGFTPAARTPKLEQEMLQHYVDEMRKNGIVSPHLEMNNLLEIMMVAKIILQYFAWVLKQFGGVGQQQGNSDDDLKSWGDKVGDCVNTAIADPQSLAKALHCDVSVAENFKRDYQAGVALH